MPAYNFGFRLSLISYNALENNEIGDLSEFRINQFFLHSNQIH